MKFFAQILVVFVLLLSCKQENSTTFPVSDYAESWVPDNQDSVLFTTIDTVLGIDTNYINYAYYNAYYTHENPNLQRISQAANSTDGTFSLQYNLSSGVPYNDQTTGKPRKVDVLTLENSGNLYTVYIGNTEITGDLFYIDTLNVADLTFVDVLTDNTNYYFTQSEGIIGFNNGSAWFYKTD